MAENLPQNQEELENRLIEQDKMEKIDSEHEKELTTAELEHGSEKHVSEIASRAEAHSKSRSEHKIHSNEFSSKHHPVYHGLREKELAWHRSMTRTRKKLSIASRTFSKFTHNPVIDVSSEFVGKTIARPSGMVGGALFAFVGSTILLWATKRYGYEYNYLAFLLLFISGLFIGIFTEFIVKITRKTRN